MKSAANFCQMETKNQMKMMNHRCKVRLLVIANLVLMSVLFPGCLSTQETAIPSHTLTLPPVLATTTHLPTENPPPSPTHPPAGTPVPLPGAILTKCAEITQSSLPPLQGTLVLQHFIDGSLLKSEISLLDLETHQEKFISKSGGEYFDNETVSPSGTYFATETFSFSRKGEYPEYHQGPIVIFNSNGNLVAEMPLTISSYEFTWLNEEQMLMNYPYEDDNPVTLISPFTHTQKKIKPFLTKIFYPSETFFDWGFYHLHKNVYDPQMTRMLYPSSDENGPNVTLRDIEQELDLASFPIGSGWGNWPIWSVDGEKLAIALNTVPFNSYVENREIRFEIFVINRNGEKLLTTNLASVAQTIYINKLSWSPNGQHIAFWYKDEARHFDTNLQLAVFDTETQTITRYCINNGDDYIRFRPIWSPNNDYLLLAYRPSKDDKARSSLLLDISDGKAWIIKSEFEPLGWLK